MIKYYLKTIIRNLIRNKFYSVINIVGLAIGITACILIMLYVQSEFSYDKYNEKADRICRVNLSAGTNKESRNLPYSSAPLRNVIQEEIPEVEEAVRVSQYWEPVMQYKEKVFNETKWCFVDDNFFKVFSTSFIYGDSSTALMEPNTVVLTETTARRYFGDENPVGQALHRKYNNDWTVTGVIKDFPENSHLKPDLLGSIKSRPYNNGLDWDNNILYTYVLVKEGAFRQNVDTKLESIVKKYVGPYMKQNRGVSLDEMTEKGNQYKYYTQPLTDIHFNRNVFAGPELSVNTSYLVIFSIIAIFILVIACINYMNMSTARSVNRAKEVGLKKSLGSNRNKLVFQFLSESLMVTLIALALALVLIQLLLPAFNHLVNKQLEFNYIGNFGAVSLLFVFGIVISIIAGSYPAFYLASFNPATVITGIQSPGGSHGTFRNGLVVFQLTVTIILFSGTFFINKQLNFIQNKELGFNKENLVIIKNAHYLWTQKPSFMNELLEQPGILEVSNSVHIPGRSKSGNTFFHELPSEAKGLSQLWVDAAFLKAYEIKLLQGRFFEKGNQANAKSIVLSESALKQLNIEDPIGKRLYKIRKSEETAFTIIGIIKDFHLNSLHQELGPLVLFDNEDALKAAGEYLSVRIAGDIQQNLKEVEQAWNKYAGGQPLDYAFFDEDFGRLYAGDVQTKKIVSIFSVLAILIACLGLLALAAFVAEQRTKEIGVRKVNGARVVQILYLLNQNFIKRTLIAFVVAVPVAWYILNKWLENFAYKTNLSWWIFALAGLLALGIALLTVSWQSWRAATRNPVEALRYE
ncbi:ABC transporter permease [Maribellus sp. CM-23]|uniref:ABC transporter permease n=1 Tax=Maribellus sp. CM-23 TaxID=2781026 RepID=UPI001F163BDE|nr:ABC transporter permease [Maribellus sp. CM-23]MCE4562922.1 ABC transporter permease [Maribellus sp. CM-23]